MTAWYSNPTIRDVAYRMKRKQSKHPQAVGSKQQDEDAPEYWKKRRLLEGKSEKEAEEEWSQLSSDKRRQAFRNVRATQKKAAAAEQ